MSDQETVGTGVESSPARDDLGQMTDEALVERMFEPQEDSSPVEETAEASAEEEYDDEEVIEASDSTLEEDSHDEEVELDDEAEVIEESYDEDSDEEPQLFTVKVDGHEQEVTLEELQRGYSGQAYIQKSMQKVAESRKEAEAIFATLAQERTQVQQALHLLQNGTLSAPPIAPDEALFNSDPMAYMEAKLQYDRDIAGYNQQLDHLQQQVQANQESQQQARQVYLERETEMLQGFAPELFDEQNGKQARSELVASAAEAYGFSPEELQQLVDHRHVRVLLDAVAFKNLNSESGKKRVEKKVQNKVVRGNKRKVNADQAARRKMKQQLKKSGSIEDAVGLMFE